VLSDAARQPGGDMQMERGQPGGDMQMEPGQPGGDMQMEPGFSLLLAMYL